MLPVPPPPHLPLPLPLAPWLVPGREMIVGWEILWEFRRLETPKVTLAREIRHLQLAQARIAEQTGYLVAAAVAPHRMPTVGSRACEQ